MLGSAAFINDLGREFIAIPPYPGADAPPLPNAAIGYGGHTALDFTYLSSRNRRHPGGACGHRLRLYPEPARPHSDPQGSLAI